MLKFSKGGSSSKSASPVRTPDTLASKDTVEALIAVSVGPIKGLVDGPRTFRADQTSLVDPGTNKPNFDGFAFDFWPGSELGHTVNLQLGGFSNPLQINQTLAFNQTVTRDGQQRGITAIDFRIVVQQLLKQNDKGTHTNTLTLKFEIKRKGDAAWQPAWVTGSNSSLPPTPVPGTGQDKNWVFKGGLPANDYSFPHDMYAEIDSTPPVAPPSNPQLPAVARSTGDGSTWHWDSTTNTWKQDLPLEVHPTHRVLQDGRRVFTTTAQPETPAPGDLWQKSSTELLTWNGVAWVRGGEFNPSVMPTGQNGIWTIDEKVSSATPKDIRVFVPKTDDDVWMFRVTKLTPDSGTEDFSVVSWESVQEIKQEPMTFRAVSMVRVIGQASDQFTALPTWNGDYDGRIVRVPSNYDPEARTYTGVWDGTYKLAWTNNNAFILQDFIENDEYGLSAIYPHTVNKWSFYEFGRYCDTMVERPDKTLRPRWTFNDYIQEPRDAQELAQYIAGSAAARYIENGNGVVDLIVDQDEPAVALFTPENIGEDGFQYSYTDRLTRANDIRVEFVNPNLNWERDYRTVPDEADIAVFGRITDNFIAVGCTDADEAEARARRRLISGLTEKEFVTFSTNRKGRFLSEWNIVLCADPEMGRGVTGRIRMQLSPTSVTLRDPLFLEPGIEYWATFTVAGADGFETVRSRITNQAGSTTLLTFADALPQLPEFAAFAVEAPDVAGFPKPYRVTNIENEDGTGENIRVTALELNRAKYPFIDTGAATTQIRYTSFGSERILPVSGLEVVSETRVRGLLAVRVLKLRWNRSPSKWVKTYKVYHSVDGTPATVQETGLTELEFEGPSNGVHVFTVVGVDLVGRESAPASYSINLTGEARKVNPPKNLRLVAGASATTFETENATFEWDAADPNPNFSGYVVRLTIGSKVLRTVDVGQALTWTYDFADNKADNNGTPARSFTVEVLAKDDAGYLSAPALLPAVSNQPPPAPTLALTTTFDGFNIRLSPPQARDVRGVLVWVSEVSGFNPLVIAPTIDTDQQSLDIPVLADGPRYVRAAYYDAFGKTPTTLLISNEGTTRTAGEVDDVRDVFKDLFGFEDTLQKVNLAAEAADKARGLAQGAQALAEGALNTAIQKAKEAAGSSGTAAGHAEHAEDMSDAASGYASTASASAKIARATARDLLPSDIGTQPQFFINAINYAPEQITYSLADVLADAPTAASLGISQPTVAGTGKVLQFTGNVYFGSIGWKRLEADRRYEARLRYRRTVTETTGGAYRAHVGLALYDANGAYMNTVLWQRDVRPIANGTWYELAKEEAANVIIATYPGATYVRPVATVNWGEAPYYQNNATTQVSFLRLEDVTSRRAAEGFAEAARVSSEAALAHRDDAEGFAEAARVSSEAALAHRDDAGDYASAAYEDRVLAETARSGAEGSFSQASGARDTAVGAASGASLSATASAASYNGARRALQAQFPSTMTRPDVWTYDEASSNAVDPVGYDDSEWTRGYFRVSEGVPVFWTSYARDAGGSVIATRQAFVPVPGRRYRVTARVRYTTQDGSGNSSNGQPVRIWLGFCPVRQNGQIDYSGRDENLRSFVRKPGEQAIHAHLAFQDIAYEWEAPAGVTYRTVRPRMHLNHAGSNHAGSTGVEVELMSLLFEDVSESHASAGFSSDAESYAGDAEQSASAASGFKTDARGFRNSAEGFRNQASGLKDEAEAFRNQASDFKDGAETFRNQASGFKDGAEGQAAIATEQASLAAKVTRGFLNANPNFSRPGDWAGDIPVYWTNWTFGWQSATKVADDKLGSHVYRVAPPGGNEHGIRWTSGNGFSRGWYVLEAMVTLESGSLVGSGLLLEGHRRTDDAGGAYVGTGTGLVFSAETDGVTETAIGAGIPGRTYVFAKLVQLPWAEVGRISLLAMTNYTRFDASIPAKTLRWHLAGVRPATAQEIEVGRARGGSLTLSAKFADVTQAAVNGDNALSGRISKWEVKSDTGNIIPKAQFFNVASMPGSSATGSSGVAGLSTRDQAAMAPWGTGWNNGIDHYGFWLANTNWWGLSAEDVLYMHSSAHGNTGTGQGDLYVNIFDVEPNQRYCFSAWAWAHRCDVQVWWACYDANGNALRSSYTDGIPGKNAPGQLDADSTLRMYTGEAAGFTGGGNSLANTKRVYSFMTTHPDTRYVQLVLRKHQTYPGQAGSNAWFARPMFSKAKETDVEPPAFSPANMAAGVSEVRLAELKLRDRVQATAGLTVNAGNRVAGMRLHATDGTDASYSSVDFMADTFRVSNGVAAEAPFEVRGNAVRMRAAFVDRLSVTTRLSLGNGTLWSLALQPQDFQVEDGQVVNFGYDLGNNPTLDFAGNNLAPLNSGETYQLTADNLTPTGFIARLKISTPGTPSNVALGPVGSSPIGPASHAISMSSRSSSGAYAVRVTGSLRFYSFSRPPGPWEMVGEEPGTRDGYVEVTVYGYNETTFAWVPLTSFYVFPPSGVFSNGYHDVAFDQTESVSASSNIGWIGVAVTDETYPESSLDTLRLDYQASGTAAGVRSATPNGQKSTVTVRPRSS